MFTIILLIPLLTYLPNQDLRSAQPAINPVAQESNSAPFNCSQPPSEQEPLIREAVDNQFGFGV
jgi:hypothetical protein